MEINLKNGSIRAHSRDVIGCIKHKTDIMISFTEKFGDEIHDIFITQKQAKAFYKELVKK